MLLCMGIRMPYTNTYTKVKQIRNNTGSVVGVFVFMYVIALMAVCCSYNVGVSLTISKTQVKQNRNKTRIETDFHCRFLAGFVLLNL